MRNRSKSLLLAAIVLLAASAGIAKQGVIFTEYPITTAGSAPTGITQGPDGALWFTEAAANKIGRITTRV